MVDDELELEESIEYPLLEAFEENELDLECVDNEDIVEPDEMEDRGDRDRKMEDGNLSVTGVIH